MSCALRSLLGRPRPLLSRLRPIRRRASRPTTDLSSSNFIGSRSRGYASNSRGGPHGEVKRHLYVVLDDHEDGYGIHKLDIGGDDDQDGDDGARRLPEPPVHRVALATAGMRVQFAGVGKRIVAIGAGRSVSCWSDHSDISFLLIYDTETAAMEVTHNLPKGLMEEGYKAAVAVGGRLYMLESASAPAWRSYSWNSGGDVHCLRTPHPVAGGGGWSSWRPLSYHSRCAWSQRSGEPLTPPFWANFITAYAAHAPAQDDHEIVVSVGATNDRDGNPMDAGIFAFSTASLEWTRRGGWQMPVDGHAHYDAGLDAWVGLHAVRYDGDTDPPCTRATDGRLCVGQITSDPTEWKVGGEQLFRLDEDFASGWRHLDAQLVPMAPGEYCLMERLLPAEQDKREPHEEYEYLAGWSQWVAKEKGCLLRLSAFRVERGHHGEPVATARRPARLYSVARYNSYFNAHAFWM